MPQSPIASARRRRCSSGVSLPHTPAGHQNGAFSSKGQTHSRRSSAQSTRSPTTPRPPSSSDRGNEHGFPGDLGGTENSVRGLGSLADELAQEEWDEYDEADGASYLQDEPSADHADAANPHPGATIARDPNPSPRPASVHDQNGPIPNDRDARASQISPSKSHPVIPDSLEEQISAVESLARLDGGHAPLESETCFARVVEQLKDLGSQAELESHATRLATAHAGLAAHLAHQTRSLASLSHPLVSPLAAPLTPETVDELLPHLATLVATLPRPNAAPLPAMRALHAGASELLTALSHLSDSLHMARQTTTLAARRLRTTREMVGTMRRELDQAEEGMRWLEVGKWEDRLKERAAAKICGEVVGGFEEVCRGWRERLAGSECGLELIAH